MQTSALINLGNVNDIPLGQGICYIVKGEEIAVFRSRDGRIFAVENRCPHRQGPLSEGIVGGGKVICPLHGHKFDLTTGKGSDPRECVKVFKAWEKDKNMMMEVQLSPSCVQEFSKGQEVIHEVT